MNTGGSILMSVNGLTAGTVKPTKHRTGSSMIIPYCDIPLADKKEDLPIKEIIIGPTPHMDLSKKSAERFINSQGLTSCEIKPSKIPYRIL